MASVGEHIMLRYWNYLKYVMSHKFWVFIYCCKLGIPIRGVVHDISKFYPCEFIPYAKYFFDESGRRIDWRQKSGYYKPTGTESEDFNRAWLHHAHANDHHWQYWVLGEDVTGIKLFEMPEKAILEMIADWCGAGRAQATPGVQNWYNDNWYKLQLHSNTRKRVESLLLELSAKIYTGDGRNG